MADKQHNNRARQASPLWVNIVIIIALIISFLAIPLRFHANSGPREADELNWVTINRSPARFSINVDKLQSRNDTVYATLQAIRNEPSQKEAVEIKLNPRNFSQRRTLPQITASDFVMIEADKIRSDTFTAQIPQSFLPISMDFTDAGAVAGAVEVVISKEYSRGTGSASASIMTCSDAALLAGVVILLAACTCALAAQPKSDGEERIPFGLRMATLLAIGIATPSTFANMVNLAEPFWLATLFTLGVLFLLLLPWKSIVTWLNGKSAFKNLRDWTLDRVSKSHLFKVVIVLSMAGACGGLARHLIANEFHAELPTISYRAVQEKRSDRRPDEVVGAKKSAVDGASRSNEEKHTIMADGRINALERMRSAYRDRPFFVVITTFFFGVLADVFIGIIAANAMLFLIIGLLPSEYHDHNGSNYNWTRAYMTLVSLGIISGFVGSQILDGQGKKLVNHLDKTAQETQDVIQSDIRKTTEDIMTKLTTESGKPDGTALTIEMNNLKGKYLWPYLAFTLPEDEPIADLEAFYLRTSDNQAGSPDVAVLRALYLLLDKRTSQTADKLLDEISRVLVNTAVQDINAAAHIIMASYYANPGQEQEAAVNAHLAQASASASEFWLKTAIELRRTWMSGPSKISNITNFSEANLKKLMEGHQALFDHVRITKALISVDKLDDANDTSTHWAKQAETVRDATALYDTSRWETNKVLRERFNHKNSNGEWNQRVEWLSPLLELASKDWNSEGNDKFYDALKKLCQNTPNWSEKEAIMKINRVIPLLSLAQNQ